MRRARCSAGIVAAYTTSVTGTGAERGTGSGAVAGAVAGAVTEAGRGQGQRQGQGQLAAGGAVACAGEGAGGRYRGRSWHGATVGQRQLQEQAQGVVDGCCDVIIVTWRCNSTRSTGSRRCMRGVAPRRACTSPIISTESHQMKSSKDGLSV